ncbi:MAG: sugar ABC transporter permease [Chloroflexota bacterium]
MATAEQLISQNSQKRKAGLFTRWLGVYRSAARRREAVEGWLFAAPWIIGLILFFAGPFIYSFVLSLTNFKIGYDLAWIGIDNYVEMFVDDRIFWKSLYNTTYFVLVGVPLGLITSLALAILMNQKLVGIPLFRTMVFVPSIVAGVAVALLWMWILDPSIGLVNHFIRSVGLPAPLWLQSETWAKPALIVMTLTGAGGAAMVIFLAGLQNIPVELYEAAKIDGATALRQFRHITLPMLSPVILFNTVTGIIGAFQVFTVAFVATSGSGSPNNATMFYALYLYNVSFWWGRMGYGAALAWFLFVVIMIFTIVQLRISRRWVYYAGG